MKRATITIPDELQAELERYVQRQEAPPELTSVVQTALREFLERQKDIETREFRPFRITPAACGSGRSDISVNHDRYLAEDAYDDSFGNS